MRHRFTLSRHVVGSESHFDLFLEHAAREKLWTWQIMEMEPVEQALFGKSDFFQVPALRIFDHRTIYLDFEGELSEKRGDVRKTETGIWELLAKTDEKLVIRLVSPQLSGKMELIFPRKTCLKAIPPPDESLWKLEYSST